MTGNHDAIDMAVMHLNVSAGPVVRPEHLIKALRSGSVHGLPLGAGALILSLFNEISPELLLRCVHEAGADIRNAKDLYHEAVSDNLPKSDRWERAVEHLS